MNDKEMGYIVTAFFGICVTRSLRIFAIIYLKVLVFINHAHILSLISP